MCDLLMFLLIISVINAFGMIKNADILTVRYDKVGFFN